MLNQGYGFSSGHVWMWKLDCEECWVPKNWCVWTVVLEKTLESPLDCKGIQPVHSKGDQSWVFIGRTDVEAETPILWPPHEKSWFIGKDSDTGRGWGQKEKGTTKDEMAGWITDWMDMSLGELWELVIDREAWHAAIHGVSKSQTQLSDWTELNAKSRKHGAFSREGLGLNFILKQQLLLLSHFSRVRLCATPQTALHRAPLSLRFSRQEHWSGLPFPSPMHESEKWKWSHSVVSYS